MDYNSNLVRAFNLITLALQIAVALVLIRRRLYREVPWFTTYICYLIAFVYILHRVYNSGDAWGYFYGLWAGTAITMVLAFMVILEVFSNLLIGYENLRKFGVALLLVIAAIALLIAIVTGPYGSSWSTPDFASAFMRSVQSIQRGIRIIQIGLLLAIFVFSSFFALSWRNYIFGIALGYGLYASVNLCTTAVQGYLANRGTHLVYPISIIDAIAFILTLILWLTYLIRPDRGQNDKTIPPASAHADLDQWNDALSELVNKKNLKRGR
jgi:hypothetical protein